MKKQVLFPVLALLLAISLTNTSCDFIAEGLCEEALGDQVAYSYDMDEITDLALSIGADVYIQKGDYQEVIIEGREDALDRLNFDVVSGLWDVRFEQGECMRNHDIKVKIIVEDLHSLKISGSGNIYADDDEINLDHLLDLKVSGSGQIFLNANAPKIQSRISGSGDIDVFGQVAELEATISGSGKFKGFDLISDDVDVRITGSGNTEVYVDGGVLDVNISGSGKVYYKGSPGSTFVDVTGSGALIDAN